MPPEANVEPTYDTLLFLALSAFVAWSIAVTALVVAHFKRTDYNADSLRRRVSIFVGCVIVAWVVFLVLFLNSFS